MAQLERQQEEKVDRRKKKPRPKGGSSLVSYHPTTAEAAKLKAGACPLPDALKALSELLDQGCKLSCGLSDKTSAYYAILRDGSLNWNEGQSISFFSDTLDKALRGLAFGLTERYPEWPSMEIPTSTPMFTDF